MAAVYRQIHLVDLDGDALRRGVERQQMTGFTGIRLHAGVDVTGMGSYLARCATRQPPPADVEQAIQDARAATVPLPDGPFDCVASVGLLTQLID